jgi:hypothetical protein
MVSFYSQDPAVTQRNLLIETRLIRKTVYQQAATQCGIS